MLDLPAIGTGMLRFSSDRHGSSEIFKAHSSGVAEAVCGGCDGLPLHGLYLLRPIVL